MKIRFALTLLLWLTACTPQPVQQQELPMLAQTESSSSPEVLPSPTFIPVQEKMTDRVIADLSERLSTKPEAVHVLMIESTIWPDSALGCPAPGEVYAQGTVPGYRIQLESGGQVYEYHTDETGESLVLCQSESPDEIPVPTLPVKPGNDKDTTPWVPVN